MRVFLLIRSLLVLWLVACLFNAQVLAQGLPELGDPAQSGFTPAQEKQLGKLIMREMRQDPDFYDDVEVTDYVSQLGKRLSAQVSGLSRAFDFFMVRDNQINAFALPGGHVGVNAGLLLAVQSESEVAGVLGHEISHVTQHHISRMVTMDKSTQWVSIAALAIALLAARTNPQLAQASATVGPALVKQQQLNYSRDYEREADRMGLQLIVKGGFDPQGMVTFFQRLERATRIYEKGAPSYLRSHPLTLDRIADMQNRIQDYPYRQVADQIEFHLVRAKLKAELENPREVIRYYQQSLEDKRYLSEAGVRYGLSLALLRIREFSAAKREFAALQQLVKSNAMVESLGCRIKLEAQDQDVMNCFRSGLKSFPHYRGLFYAFIEALLRNRQPDAVLQLVQERLLLNPDDYHLYQFQAEAYALSHRTFFQHKALAEAYVRLDNLPGAIDQLQIGIKAADGDYYQLSAAEARLRDLLIQDSERRKEEKENR